MSRAIITVTMSVEGEPEALVHATSKLEEVMSDFFCYQATLHSCSVSVKNTFEPADARCFHGAIYGQCERCANKPVPKGGLD